MRAAIAVLLFIVCCYSSPLQEAEYQSLFTKWAVMHGKNYELDTFFKRYSIFKQNLDYINDHNAQSSSFELAMNKFGDLTVEEFSATYKGLVRSNHNTSEPFVEIQSNPKDSYGSGGSLDWRNRGAVNSVQDQKGCGSCYAFAAVAAVEGAWAIKKGVLHKLSEQQIVDCSRQQGNKGCNGGCIGCAYDYVISKGLVVSSKYPYVGKDGSCQASAPSAAISSYKSINNNEAALMAAVNLGPVSTAIAASGFQFYSKGVLDISNCGTKLDHGVTIIGYGTSAAGQDYWIVRNSWGTSWGENGYVRMVRNKNMCGLALHPDYPVV